MIIFDIVKIDQFLLLENTILYPRKFIEFEFCLS